MACERSFSFEQDQSEPFSVFGNDVTFEAAVRSQLPSELRDLDFRVDTARHVQRPGGKAATADKNFLFTPGSGRIGPLDERDLFRRIPVSYRVCRIYTRDHSHDDLLNDIMDTLAGSGVVDDPTNM